MAKTKANSFNSSGSKDVINAKIKKKRKRNIYFNSEILNSSARKLNVANIVHNKNVVSCNWKIFKENILKQDNIKINEDKHLNVLKSKSQFSLKSKTKQDTKEENYKNNNKTQIAARGKISSTVKFHVDSKNEISPKMNDECPIVGKNDRDICVDRNKTKTKVHEGFTQDAVRQSKEKKNNFNKRKICIEDYHSANQLALDQKVDGFKNNSLNTPKNRLTRFVAMDCEMVGVNDGKESVLARVSLVNKYGDCIYDKFVKSKERVVDYRTSVSGIRPRDLVNGEDFEKVQKEVAAILKGRILVGHALSNDLKVLYLNHPKRRIRDTARYEPFRKLVKGRTPGLKKLASELLGVTIQQGEHDSVTDARTAMHVYMLYRKEWEREHYSKKPKVKK